MDRYRYLCVVVVSAIYFAVVCWGDLSAKDASRINKLIRKALKIIGQNLEIFESVRDRRSLNKLLHHGQPITPVPLISEAAELRLPQTD